MAGPLERAADLEAAKVLIIQERERRRRMRQNAEDLRDPKRRASHDGYVKALSYVLSILPP